MTSSAREADLPASVRNAPDLSDLASSQSETAPAGVDSAPTWRYEVNSGEDFQNYVQLSAQGAVVFALYSQHSPASLETVENMQKLVDSAAGTMILATVDIDRFPEIAQAFQVSGVPAGIAVVKGQPAPMFNSVLTLQQLTDLLQQVLQLAAAQQLPGGFAPFTGETEKPLPPLHQEALDALDRGDYDAAHAAYTRALNENPGDTDAKIGLAQVGLLSRVNAEGKGDVRALAAADPKNIQAAFDVADLDIAGGHVEDAFARLINLFKAVDADSKNSVRQRLLELFEVVGTHDPRVTKARADLMMALF